MDITISLIVDIGVLIVSTIEVQGVVGGVAVVIDTAIPVIPKIGISGNFSTITPGGAEQVLNELIVGEMLAGVDDAEY